MLDSDTDDSLWLRRFQPTPRATTRLLCLPHAGGSASTYVRLARSLAPEVEVLAVQYPGRQDRRCEPCADSVEALADALFTAVRHRIDASTALFGHSMGAVLAFELARRLERDADIRCTRLFASGRRAPARFRDDSGPATSDAAMLAELRSLGGTDLRVLQDEELVTAALPALRADYRAISRYRAAEDAAIDCPITVLVGDADPRTSLDDAHAWSGHTTVQAEVLTFPGGHFFLDANHDAVVDAVTSRLREDRATCADPA
ncbi:thioesterase II family protein [Streptomyces sp. NPDC020800]|uniref:thioesterase II family protein n=1 Tax=Streptomyces sp. NPDC020800 TaxID=3365092 RepID=UPI0037A46A02